MHKNTRSHSTTKTADTDACSSEKLEIIKNEILLEFQKFRDKYEEDISELKSTLSELTSQNVTLKKKIKALQAVVDDEDDIITDLEKTVAEHQQYTRRNNIEIVGIPDSVTQDSLEQKIIELAGAVKIPLENRDIEACHRLKKKRNAKGPRITIVRFVNRKHAEQMHCNKKNLTKKVLKEIGLDEHKIYINNNLCPYYRTLMGKASELYKERKS